jgi:hypothetical protein
LVKLAPMSKFYPDDAVGWQVTLPFVFIGCNRDPHFSTGKGWQKEDQDWSVWLVRYGSCLNAAGSQ